MRVWIEYGRSPFRSDSCLAGKIPGAFLTNGDDPAPGCGARSGCLAHPSSDDDRYILNNTAESSVVPTALILTLSRSEPHFQSFTEPFNISNSLIPQCRCGNDYTHQPCKAAQRLVQRLDLLLREPDECLLCLLRRSQQCLRPLLHASQYATLRLLFVQGR